MPLAAGTSAACQAGRLIHPGSVKAPPALRARASSVEAKSAGMAVASAEPPSGSRPPTMGETRCSWASGRPIQNSRPSGWAISSAK